MEDAQIVDLYFQRDEAAISETAAKYGDFCHGIAFHILSVHADADECVNDAYWRTWNAIPPQRPVKLGAWLGKVVRNIALDLWKKNHRQKRYAGLEQLLDEWQDCVPSPQTMERELEEEELTEVINAWLLALPQKDRVLFVRRYWAGESVRELAGEYNATPNSLAKRLFKLRRQLKHTLEQEGYSI